MSRRLRAELQHVDTERAEEEAKDKQQKARIISPLVWKRLDSGVRIEDLKPKYFQEALEMIKEYYVVEEVLCRNTNLKDDKESLESYLKLVHYYLRDLTSLVAIKEITNNEDDQEEEKHNDDIAGEEIVGISVMKVMHKSDYDRAFNRNVLTEGKALKTCLTLINYLDRKSDIYKELNCESFLQYLQICIKPEYRHQGLGYQMMLCGIDEARTLSCPAVMGIFSSSSLQKSAKLMGMQVILEMYYREWKDKLDNPIFNNTGEGNDSCAVMAYSIPSAKRSAAYERRQAEKQGVAKPQQRGRTA